MTAGNTLSYLKPVHLRELMYKTGYMTRYFTSCDSIVTSRRQVEIQSKSEMSTYFTMTKCNNCLLHTLPSLPSSISTISTISMTVVMTTLFLKKTVTTTIRMLGV